uniref:Uncharacterized protein n=1 Tax=Anguilla anguilla TaxID=7936 RepID=A0A0E9TLB4_ANGAN
MLQLSNPLLLSYDMEESMKNTIDSFILDIVPH